MSRMEEPFVVVRFEEGGARAPARTPIAPTAAQPPNRGVRKGLELYDGDMLTERAVYCSLWLNHPCEFLVDSNAMLPNRHALILSE